MMRHLLATFIFGATACAGPGVGQGGGAYSAASPALKPETIAGCNAVNLKIDLAGDGMIRVNGEPASMEGVERAARKKDEACQTAAAMVVYSYDAASPAATRDAIELLLKRTIVNLSLIEAGQG